MAAVYSIYCVKARVGWHGVFISINLAFLSNGILNYLLHWCDNLSESSQSIPFEQHIETDSFTEEDFTTDYESSVPSDDTEKVHSCKSSSQPAITTTLVNKPKEPPAKQVAREDTNSLDEMKRILNSADHYEAVGFSRHKKIDTLVLKKEYRKKVQYYHFMYVNKLSLI